MTEELAWGPWSESLLTRLIEEIPELEGAYRKRFGGRGNSAMDTLRTFQRLLRGYTFHLLRSGENVEEMRRFFGLLESMCSDEDHRVREVAVRCVFEILEYDEDRRDWMSPYLGDLSRQAVRDLTEARILRDRKLNARLFEVFPELEEPYFKELKYSGEVEEPGPHTVYGELMNPHVRKLLESGDQPAALRKAFDLVEAMCGDEDERVQEVAVVTVLEGLAWKPEWREAMMPYLGPLTKEAWDVMINWRPKPLES